MKKLMLLMTGIIALSVTCTFAQPDNAKLQIEDYFDIESVSSPQISPDGSHIIYGRRWVNKYDDRSQTDLWIMEADGGNNRYFMEGNSPLWSPDGKKIAFTKKGEPQGTQIFVKIMGVEGPATQITRLDNSPSSIKWSPDGKHISFTMLVPDKDRWPIKMPEKPDGAQWTTAPRIIEDLVYRRDRSGFIEDGYTHIFVVPAEGGTARQVTHGDWHHGRGAYSWTRDGKEILFSSLRVENAEYQYRESEIYAVNVGSGDIRQLTDRKGPDGNPLVSPDNKHVIYTGYDWTDDTYINSKFYLMNLDGSGSRMISGDFDRSASAVKWAKDNSGVYVNVREEGTANLYFIPLRGKVRQITEGTHMLSVSSVSDNGIAVATVSDPYLPGDVFSFPISDPELKKLTAVNDDVLTDVKLGEVEEIWYKSTGDVDIQGWIIKPPDFDPGKKYPLILSIHGGPHGMYGVGFNFRWQIHAAEGYVVLYTNPRGSAGYGSEFGNMIKNDYPNKDFDDLMKGVDEVIAKGYIDEDNLFVYGGSGGGVLTAWIVGHTDRFAAASSNYPVIDWLSFVGTTDGVSWYRNFEKMPWEDPSEHLRRSPLMYVGNVTTPTMLMTGVKDLRTPISQTEEFYQALKIQKVPTAMLRFNDEFHGTSSNPSNYIRTILYLHHWFEKYKK
ncbi:MAG: S9 family peptidase [Bacteroidales bacterium]|nr:S9 family peptidase [Bacteroidales bacterium]